MVGAIKKNEKSDVDKAIYRFKNGHFKAMKRLWKRSADTIGRYCRRRYRRIGLVMSTIPKWKQKRSDIGDNYRNETKTFWCVPKKEVERFYLVQKLWIEFITFLMCSRTFKIEIGTFLLSLKTLNRNQNVLICSRILKTKSELFLLI